jgi:hypothetical protein
VPVRCAVSHSPTNRIQPARERQCLVPADLVDGDVQVGDCGGWTTGREPILSIAAMPTTAGAPWAGRTTASSVKRSKHGRGLVGVIKDCRFRHHSTIVPLARHICTIRVDAGL